MAKIDDLKETYLQLDQDLNLESEEAIRQDQLLTFEYEYKGSNAEVVIDTDEFTESVIEELSSSEKKKKRTQKKKRTKQ